MITGIRLIIYDLDGVLVDTSDAICISFNAALEDAGEAPRSDEEIRGMIGVPLDEMYRRVLPRERWGLVEGCFERYREVFMEVSPWIMSASSTAWRRPSPTSREKASCSAWLPTSRRRRRRRSLVTSG
jgi:phosphoglycolate phosphatase-like HAD superfamily hydrolase